MFSKNKFSASFFSQIFLLLFSFLLFSCGGNNDVKNPDDKDENETEDLNAYITEVFEYVYAPGQHAESRKKTDAEKFIGKPYNDVYLGGFGGYIIAGFNHNVKNEQGEYDFEVFSSGVSPEPAVVYVMCDENGDGLPNEIWYELKGNLFDNEATIRNYSVTYYKPESDEMNIRWTDDRGNSGELIEGNNVGRTTAHWWWEETKEASITFTGTRLSDSYVNQPTTDVPENWIVSKELFQWGYAENNYGVDYNNESKSNRFDISNAVDENGNMVDLPHIRFVKIQSAVFQQPGWLNEVSSEVKGAKDLHY